ncbi:MAG: hypothetical protein JW809_04545 [Pirellulales bacterium]|nr:hypothetical protein [Pirellulales bacterium]
MSASSQEDWGGRALGAVETANTREALRELTRRQERHWLGAILVRFALLIFLSVGLIWFGGFSWLFAVLLVAWFLFWPR